LVYYIALSLTLTMVIILGGAGFAFGDPAAHAAWLPGAWVGRNDDKPNVHGFVRWGTEFEFWNMFLDAPGGCCCKRYFARSPRDGLADDASAAGSAFW
jgi:hypothetical protein